MNTKLQAPVLDLTTTDGTLLLSSSYEARNKRGWGISIFKCDNNTTTRIGAYFDENELRALSNWANEMTEYLSLTVEQQKKQETEDYPASICLQTNNGYYLEQCDLFEDSCELLIESIDAFTDVTVYMQFDVEQLQALSKWALSTAEYLHQKEAQQ